MGVVGGWTRRTRVLVLELGPWRVGGLEGWSEIRSNSVGT